MKITKDMKQGGRVDVHFGTNDKAYLMVSHGTTEIDDEYGHYGSRYMSLAPELAIDLAKEILKKAKKNEK